MILFTSVTLSGSGAPQNGRFAFFAGAEPLFNQIENYRDEENSDEAPREHAPDHRGAHDLASHCSGARSGPQRDGAKNEGKRSHQDRPKAQAGSFQSSVN